MDRLRMEYFQYGDKEMAYLKAQDPALGAVIDRFGHLERAVMPDLFEALVRAIVGQQISVQAVRTVFGRMQEDLGAITPETILKRSEDEIQAYGMTFRKAQYIRSAAERIASGEIDLDSLHELDDKAVEQLLVQLDGVGPWTAEMLMIFSLQRPDVISFGDLAIIRGMKRIYGYEKVTREIFRKHRETYSPYATTAALYIWKAAADVPDAPGVPDEATGGLG